MGSRLTYHQDFIKSARKLPKAQLNKLATLLEQICQGVTLT